MNKIRKYIIIDICNYLSPKKLVKMRLTNKFFR